MSEAAEQSGTERNAGEWFSTSQAAFALGVSERTVQRRCGAGQLDARRVTDANGERWEVRSDGRGGVAAGKGAAIGADRVPTRFHAQDVPQAALNGGTVPTLPPRVPTGADRGADTGDSAEVGRLRGDLEREREQVKFLRGLVEARDRDAAELRAALRKALDNAARALPQGGPEPRLQPREEAFKSANFADLPVPEHAAASAPEAATTAAMPEAAPGANAGALWAAQTAGGQSDGRGLEGAQQGGKAGRRRAATWIEKMLRIR